jgi:DNA-binding NarL/FixJ family response regulator
MSLRVVIVADDPTSASALRSVLRATFAFDVVNGYAEGRASCTAVAVAHRPDMVVVDQLRAPADSLARIGELRGALPDAKIVLLSATMDPALLTAAAAAGIDAAVAKTPRLEGLGVLIREVAAGNVFHAFDTVRAEPPKRDLDYCGLTTREREILALVASGASNSRIARQLWVTEQTVKFHLSNVYRKLGVANRTEASHHAHMYGLLEPSAPVGPADGAQPTVNVAA